jgi:heptaprenyl diphosphate synthase
MLSDATPDDLETLGAFGESLGLAFQLSDDIMDITSTQLELGKEPGTDIREGVYTIPVLHELREGPGRDELRRILAAGPPDGELLDRALEIIRAGGAIEHARAGVAGEVTRAIELAGRLPEGHAQHALVQLARFLGVRCGAEASEGAGPEALPGSLLGYGRAGEGTDGS